MITKRQSTIRRLITKQYIAANQMGVEVLPGTKQLLVNILKK